MIERKKRKNKEGKKENRKSRSASVTFHISFVVVLVFNDVNVTLIIGHYRLFLCLRFSMDHECLTFTRLMCSLRTIPSLSLISVCLNNAMEYYVQRSSEDLLVLLFEKTFVADLLHGSVV